MGTTVFAGCNSGGYGNLVVVQHRLGYTTWYAHLSRITSWAGEHVEGGTRLGYVGSTGHSTGPHLHFEVRLNNVPINPVPYLLAGTAARATGVTVKARCADPAAYASTNRRLPLGTRGSRPGPPWNVGQPAYVFSPRAIACRSSASSSVSSSTPFSNATSRIVRCEATASLTISVPRS